MVEQNVPEGDGRRLGVTAFVPGGDRAGRRGTDGAHNGPGWNEAGRNGTPVFHRDPAPARPVFKKADNTATCAIFSKLASLLLYTSTNVLFHFLLGYG
jgi:hypothetical protein